MNRCARHMRVPVNNLNAAGGSEECGGCIMEEVFFLVASRLDILEILADLLVHHAKIRVQLSEARARLEFYEPSAERKERLQ